MRRLELREMSRLPQRHALCRWRRRGAATSATPRIWPCWLSKGVAQGIPASGRACCHPHRSSPAIGTHCCLRNINRPLAASQANVRASKELLPLTPLCSLHPGPRLPGKHMGAHPTGFPNSHASAGRPNGAQAGRAHSPGRRCPL